jgi:transcription initiation factor TFIIF subunit beta
LKAFGGEQTRSYLYERNKRERQRKENKEKGKKFEPYARKPITKQTAIAGIVEKDLECVPVKNEEFYVLEARETESMLKIPERPQAIFGKSGNRQPQYMLSQAEKKKITQANQAKKQKAKDDRSARVSRADLIDKLLQCFKTHRIWGLRDLKAVVNQPEQYVREILQEIAFMWKSGDWNGKYELKDEYKAQDAALLNPTNSEVAPEAEDSEDEEEFEDGL